MKIRKARLADAQVIATFNARLAWETERRHLNLTTLNRGVRAVLRDATKGFYLVADYKGAVIGQLLITTEWSDWRNGNFWWIQSVYVTAPHRQKGVFTALYQHAARLAAARHGVCGLRLYVEHHNRRAQRSYQRLGFELTPYRLFEAPLPAQTKLAPARSQVKLRA